MPFVTSSFLFLEEMASNLKASLLEAMASNLIAMAHGKASTTETSSDRLRPTAIGFLFKRIESVSFRRTFHFLKTGSIPDSSTQTKQGPSRGQDPNSHPTDPIPLPKRATPVEQVVGRLVPWPTAPRLDRRTDPVLRVDGGVTGGRRGPGEIRVGATRNKRGQERFQGFTPYLLATKFPRYVTI